MNLIKINITVTGSHVECHTYSKWPSSNNKMYIKGISTFTVIMLTETTYNSIWLKNYNSICSQRILIKIQLAHHVIFLLCKNTNVASCCTF